MGGVMSQIVIAGDTSGTITLQAPAVSGSNTITLPASTGTMMVNGPAFAAYGSALTSAASAAFTKITFDTKVFDTNTNYSTANSRFTPTVAGYYQFNSYVFGPVSASGVILSTFFKNGSRLADGANIALSAGANVTSQNSAIIYLNGSTDYVEVYGYQSSTGTQSIGSQYAFQQFSGAMIRSASWHRL